MGYRWKPNASQRAAYKEKCEEKESLNVITTPYVIREGCYVEYYSMSKGTIICGYIIKSSYGSEKNQHTFTINTGNEKICVKGRNIYPNIIKHIPGVISKQLNLF
jgi:hypothetical protein